MGIIADMDISKKYKILKPKYRKIVKKLIVDASQNGVNVISTFFFAKSKPLALKKNF